MATRQKNLRRDYEEVLQDIVELRQAISLAVKAVEVGSADNNVKRDLDAMQDRLRSLQVEASRYNPSTGKYRGMRIMTGVPV